MTASPKISQTGKMPCKSWSLPAGPSCPGSVDPSTKEPYSVCAQCYAKRGMYRFPRVKDVREHNMKDWKQGGWIDAMVRAIGTDPFFRWFDSGDLYHPRLAQKIFSVCKYTPKTKHWIPTKSWDIPKLMPWIELLEGLPNVTVRKSDKEVIRGAGVYTPSRGLWSVVATDGVINGATKEEAYYCPADQQGGKCLSCRACWDKDINLIVYPLRSK